MSNKRSNMIGLSLNCARLYDQIVDLCAKRYLPPRERDIKAHRRGKQKQMWLARLQERGFISIDRFGRITALEPPHLIVMQETCAMTGLSEDEIRSKRQFLKFVRARRIITKRLNGEFNYPSYQIAKVINCRQTTVGDYLNLERTLKRSKERMAARRYAKQAHVERVAA